MGANVILACRNSLRAEEAIADIQREQREILNTCKLNSFMSQYYNKIYPYCSYGSVQYAYLDLNDMKSIKTFVSIELTEKLGVQRIDILVNNAGLNTRGVTKHGLQQLFQVNYLGHYLLFNECLPLLQKHKQTSRGIDSDGDQDHGRVVNLSSICHHFGTDDFQYSATTNKSSFNFYHHYYDDSKYYMNLFTLEINRRYSRVTSVRCNASDTNAYKYKIDTDEHKNGVAPVPPRPVIAVSVNPGAVRSDIWRSVPKYVLFVYDLLMRCLFLNVSQGAGTSIYACYTPLSILLNSKVTNGYSEAVKLIDNPHKSYLVTHPFIPYLIPYYMLTSNQSFKNPFTIVLNLICEGFGLYVGPQWSTVTLNPHVEHTAFQLWEYSKDMCNGICSN